jgi:Protein of unknown function (DUF1570)
MLRPWRYSSQTRERGRYASLPRLRVGLVFVPLLVGIAASSSAADPPASPAGRWKLETIVLKSGKEHHGLVQARRGQEIDFAEIVQRPGKPMFAIIRGIDAAQVAKAELLPPDEHAELVKKFHDHRHKALIEAGEMEKVKLAPLDADGHSFQSYRGPEFTLLSTADEESTRRCVVRMEQIFRAYRTLLPPLLKQKAEEEKKPELTIYLYSSLDEYRQRLRTLELNLNAPAIYSARHHQILAGGEMAHYAKRLADVRKEMVDLEKQYDKLDKDFATSLARLSDELRTKGFGKDEITQELQLRKADWKNERAAVMARMAEQDRRNLARFSEVTREMFARLYHEAFHAYLDSYVYPQGSHHVPTWLHEGLAQVFEGGQLEGDSLRIDAPDRERLKLLLADLNSSDPLPLARLLVAEERTFAGDHGGRASKRHYLYAWGLSYYLVTEKNLLGSPALDEFVSPQAADLSPAARLEKLVHQPLDKFEAQWRKNLRKLAVPGK